MRYLPLIIILALLLPSTLAVTGVLTKTDFSATEIVEIKVTKCAVDSLVQIKSPDLKQQSLEGGVKEWVKKYSAASHKAKGKYSANIICGDKSKDVKLFCVDSPDCLKPKKACVASFTDCGEYTECTNGVQKRDCADVNKCDAKKTTKSETKFCTVPKPIPPVVTTTSEDDFDDEEDEDDFDDDFDDEDDEDFEEESSSLGLIIAIVLIVLVLGGGVGGFLWWKKQQGGGGEDLTQLEDWIAKARAAGQTDDQIKATLSQGGEWKPDQIDNALAGK